MREGWRRVRLGEFLRPAPRPVVPEEGRTYKQLTLAINGRGARLRTVVDGAEARASRQFVARAGDLIVSKIDARKGAAAVVPHDLDGAIVTSDFPTFEIDRRQTLPSFLDLFVRRAEFAQLADTISAGTTNRVRMDMSRFRDLAIDLPPLAEQRRIVDLIAAVDEALEASRTYLGAVGMAITRVRETALATAGDRVRLGSLLESIEAGRSPEAEDRQPLTGEAAVLKVSAVRAGRFDPTQVKVLNSTDGFSPRSRLRRGDVLMTRANTRELVGAVCRVLEAPPDYYLCDKTLRLNPRVDLVDPDYLVEVLLADAAREQIELAATGTSGSMKNISQKTIRDLRVPLIDAAEQRRLVRTVSALRRTAAAIDGAVASLASLRGALLADLLSGDHEIPASYDRFLDGAA